MTGPTRPIPRPDVPQGVPTPLSEVVLPPTDSSGAYDPLRRPPASWFAQLLKDVHQHLVDLEADARTRQVVMHDLLLAAEPEERALFFAGAVYDPVLEDIARELS